MKISRNLLVLVILALVTSACGPSVEASVSYQDLGTTDMAVRFTALVHGDGLTYIEWDFGDGSPKENIRNPTHQYRETGTYTATVFVKYENGSTASSSLKVTVPKPK